MEGLLATIAGKSPSLAESSDYRDLLKLMLDHSAVSVFMSSETVGRDAPDDGLVNALYTGFTAYAAVYGLSDAQINSLRDRIIPSILPLPFETYALGTVWDDAGFHTIIAYAYPTDADALASLPRVETRFDRIENLRERLYSEVYGVSTFVEGRIVVVQLGQNVTSSLIKDIAPIFVHE